MYRNKTLFVVGAGASAEVDLPVGIQLATTISSSLDFRFNDFGRYEGGGDGGLYQALQIKSHPDPALLIRYRRAARQICDGLYLANSIDNYIDTFNLDDNIALVGKAAIIHAILKAEASSRLFVDRDKGDRKLEIINSVQHLVLGV